MAALRGKRGVGYFPWVPVWSMITLVSNEHAIAGGLLTARKTATRFRRV